MTNNCTSNQNFTLVVCAVRYRFVINLQYYQVTKYCLLQKLFNTPAN